MDNVPVAFIERVIPLGRVSLANLADLEKLGPRWHSVAREVESKYNYNWIKLYNDVRKLVISNKGYNKDPVLPKDFKWVNAFTLDAKIQIRAKSSGNRLAREEPLELSPKLLTVSSIPCVGYESSLEMFDLDRQTESINLGKYLNCLQGPFIMIHVENVRGYAQELERILRRSVEANLTGKYRFLDSEFTPAVPDLLMEHWAKWNLTPRRSGYEARRFDRTIIFTGCNVQLRIPHIRKAIDTWIVDNKGGHLLTFDCDEIPNVERFFQELKIEEPQWKIERSDCPYYHDYTLTHQKSNVEIRFYMHQNQLTLIRPNLD